MGEAEWCKMSGMVPVWHRLSRSNLGVQGHTATTRLFGCQIAALVNVDGGRLFYGSANCRFPRNVLGNK